MQLTIYHVDAFAQQPFQGNAAAVCLLDDWLPDVLMQAIASELNLSETTFLVKRKPNEYRIRWFAPKQEISLCGHATLAAAHVLYEHLDTEKKEITFQSLSGPLKAFPNDRFQTAHICLDFPEQKPSPIAMRESFVAAAGGQPLRALEQEDLVLIYGDASEVEILEPDLTAIAQLPYRGLCVAAPGNGNGYDFVLRFFAPNIGIPEDPVTGSALTKLTPLFAEQFNKTQLKSKQLSKRGGEAFIELADGRVFISGQALTLMIGSMKLPL